MSPEHSKHATHKVYCSKGGLWNFNNLLKRVLNVFFYKFVHFLRLLLFMFIILRQQLQQQRNYEVDKVDSLKFVIALAKKLK